MSLVLNARLVKYPYSFTWPGFRDPFLAGIVYLYLSLMEFVFRVLCV